MDKKEAVMNEGNDFAAFYRENLDLIYHYIYRIIPNRQLAEDLTQETFYTALVKQDELWGHPNPKLWLMRIARYKMMEFRKSMRYRKTEPLDPEGIEAAELDAGYGITELNVIAGNMLGEKEWQLIKKYYLFGATISELAEAEGISENNMRVRLSRWTKQLRNKIDG